MFIVLASYSMFSREQIKTNPICPIKQSGSLKLLIFSPLHQQVWWKFIFVSNNKIVTHVYLLISGKVAGWAVISIKEEKQNLIGWLLMKKNKIWLAAHWWRKTKSDWLSSNELKQNLIGWAVMKKTQSLIGWAVMKKNKLWLANLY